MKTILSTFFFLVCSLFITAQEFELSVESDFCQCVYLEVSGPEIEFFDVQFEITDFSGNIYATLENNPTEFCQLFPGFWLVNATVSINENIIWEAEESFDIFYQEIFLFPIDVCGSLVNGSTGAGCATAYANELATYGISGWPFQVTVNGGEIVQEDFDEVTILWGDTGQGSVSAIGECFAFDEICVDIIEGPEASFTATPAIVNNTIEACAGQNIFFENTSTGAEDFSWRPGTGENFSNTNLQYAYQNPGTYEMVLIASGEFGCPDTSTVTVEIIEGLAPSIDCIGTVCAGEIVTYTSSDDCGTFDWSVSSNGVITNGGRPDDDFVTIEWIDGHIGEIELTVSSCTGDYCTRPAMVRIPIISPGATIIGDATVCNNTIKTYSMPNYTGTEFNWSVSNRGTIESGQGTNEITVSWNSGTVPVNNQSVSVTYDNCYLGCGGSANLPVRILREFFTSGSIVGCENDSDVFTANRSTGGTANAIVDWRVVTPDGLSVQTELATATFTATWNAGPGNYQIIATANDPDDFCTDEYILNFNVLPRPPTLTSIDGVTEICPGQPYTYKVTGEPNHTFRWNINNGGVMTQQNGANITVVWDNNGPYSLSVTQTNPIASCVSEAYDLNINAIPPVSVTGNSDACVDEQTSYAATAIDNVDYNWSVIPASAGTLTGEVTSANPEVLWHEPGNATLELSVCGQTESIQVVVHGKPEPTVLFPGSLCANETSTISTTTTFDTYQWINESGNTISNDPAPDLGPGYYELVVTNNFGCIEDTTFFIDPLPVPKVRISSPTPIWFCPGGTFPTLYAVDTDSGYDFQWFVNGVPTGTNAPTFTTSDFGDYQVQVTDENGCQNFSNVLKVIDICDQTPPDTLVTSGCTLSTIPSFVKDFPAPLCDEHSYTSTTTGHIPGTLRWNFDDNTPVQTGNVITHRFEEAGFYRVRHYAQFDDPLNPGQIVSCSRTIIDTILISAAFDADLACPGGTTQFTDISTFLPITSIASWNWNFGDPASGSNNTSTEINPVHVFSNEGNYEVTLTITDPSGCVSVRTETITVHPRPAIDFAEPTIQCEAVAMEFNLNTLSGVVTSVNWDFGDPASGEANTSALENTFHEYDTPGSYEVTLFATNIYGCTNSYNRTITVEPNSLNGDITLSQPSPLCEGESTTLTAPAGGSSWLWSSGETTENITVAIEDVYTVTVTDDQGCTYSPAEVVIDIVPAPVGTIRAIEYDEYGQLQDYFYENPLELCEGEDLFLEISATGNYSYSWSTGSSQTILEYSQERGNLLSAGTYDYSVTITDNTTGCTAEIGPTQVIVHDLPAAFTINAAGGSPVCAGTNAILSVNNPDNALTYRWSNGETGPSIIALKGGSYWATAINSFGCETESNRIFVSKGPNVSLVPMGCHTRCTPDTICVPPVPNVTNYQWYLDGSPVSGENSREFIATNSGFYQLEMTDNQGCTLLSEGLSLTLSPGFGHIRGFVYDDVNQNMMVDAGDSLLTNVTVNLIEGGTVVATRISNQNAEYIFENTPNGDYTIQVDASTLPSNYMPIIEEVDVTISGCDVDEIISLLVQETQCAIFSSSLTLNTCNGVVVPYGGELLSPGTTPVVLTAENGCDSTVTVTVVDNVSFQTTESYTACVGTSYDYFGTSIPAGSSQPITFTSAAGCDSIVTVTILETQSITTTESYAACAGTSYDYFGTSIPAGTSQPITFTSSAGCDSIVTVMISETQPITTMENYAACVGTSYDYFGTSIPAGSSQPITFTSAAGCDSIVTVTISETQPMMTTESYAACAGTSYDYFGTSIPAGTSQPITFTSSAGCDSIVTVTILETQSITTTESYAACAGTNYDYYGTSIPAGSSQPITFTSAAGCDSIVTVTISETQPITTMESYAACAGTNYDYFGTSIPAGSSQPITFTSAAGCDSIVTVTILETQPITTTESYAACVGTSYDYFGTSIPAGSSQPITFTSAAGCDSIVTVTILETQPIMRMESYAACAGTSYDYFGTSIPAGSSQPITFTSSAGCDSIVTVTIDEYPEINFAAVVTETCEAAEMGTIEIVNGLGGGGPYLYELSGTDSSQTSALFEFLAGGDYELMVTDVNGCTETEVITVPVIAPLVVALDDATLECGEAMVRVVPEMSGDIRELSYEWSDGTTDFYNEIAQAGSVSLTVNNICGSETVTATVTAEKDIRENWFYIPNIFSPNGDNQNDFFTAIPVEDIQVVEFEMRVIGRWGGVVYSTKSISEGWNGLAAGRLINSGVYIYQIRATIETCGEVIKVDTYGDVTLIR